MRIFHLSDLHIGKLVYGYDMEADQRYVFNQIISYVREKQPDVVVIAGDIYDKALPSAKAVKLFDDFLTELADGQTAVLVISGNHDSAERLDYGSRIMEKNNVFIKGSYDGTAQRVVLEDAYGAVNFYLMPFVKPIDIREYAEEECTDYSQAMSIAIGKMGINEKERNVLVAHQNVTNGGKNKKCESELVTIGNVDNIESWVFDAFDYVALGHLHTPQNIGSERIRYCGTPVTYSMSEADDEKSVTMITLEEKNSIKTELLPLKQLHGWYDFKGTLKDALNREYNEDYARIMLTDKDVIIDALHRLRAVYGRLLLMEFETRKTVDSISERTVADVEKLTPIQAFADFYMSRKGSELSEKDRSYIEKLCKEWEDKS